MSNQVSAAGHASSTGQVFAAIDWLDAHFEMARPEYEAIVQSVGLQPGWRVLDAGCGTGGFLPLLAELVGSSGALVALDIEPESITAIQERLDGWALPCHVETRVGGLDALPYSDASFDAVWCANVTQYLSDEDLMAALAEFRRVVRPGGLVAIKDVDGNLMRAPSRVPGLIQHLREARIRAGSTQALGAIRGPELRTWIRRAGLVEVSLRTTLVERWPPYRPAERHHPPSPRMRGWRMVSISPSMSGMNGHGWSPSETVFWMTRTTTSGKGTFWLLAGCPNRPLSDANTWGWLVRSVSSSKGWQIRNPALSPS
ncbi:MAG: methyltransferase domain-containing protein [Chloroflexota bacterium]|nr:methyltransferase domain-containing protein [Chloroflexota bacterium]